MQSLITGSATNNSSIAKRIAKREFASGDLILDEYEVLSLVGQGTLGAVYRCSSRRLGGKDVALKVISQTGVQDSLGRARLQKAVMTAHGIEHPNVARLHDCICEDHNIYLVSDFVTNGSLESHLKKGAPSLKQGVQWLYQTCQGLCAIHEAGILHRDLTPANILIDGDGAIKLTDFGIISLLAGDARKNDPADAPQTTELLFHCRAFKTDGGSLVGTPYYLSPEYLENGQITEALDIYALGVIAYQVITNTFPFATENLFELIRSKLFTDPQAPHAIRKECPEKLGEIVLHAMNRDPKLRIQSARTFANLLEPWTESEFREAGLLGKLLKHLTQRNRGGV